MRASLLMCGYRVRDKAPDEDECRLVLVPGVADVEMERWHPHGEERDEQHDDPARSAIGEECGAREEDDENEDRRDVAGA